MLLAIDPGTTQSGYVVLDGEKVVESGVVQNGLMRHMLEETSAFVVIEMLNGMGQAVGQSTLETCVWVGRFMEVAVSCGRIFRKDVKMHLCNSARARDSNIWQAVMDRYGSEKSVAVGNKKNPGPLYGVSSHARQALAVGLCWLDGVRSEGI